MALALGLGLAAPAPAESPVRQPAYHEESAADRAWQILRDGVNDKKFATRIAALTALADAGPNVRGAHLAEGALHDKDPDIRAQAATTLGAMKYRPAMGPLSFGMPLIKQQFGQRRSFGQSKRFRR